MLPDDEDDDETDADDPDTRRGSGKFLLLEMVWRAAVTGGLRGGGANGTKTGIPATGGGEEADGASTVVCAVEDAAGNDISAVPRARASAESFSGEVVVAPAPNIVGATAADPASAIAS